MTSSRFQHPPLTRREFLRLASAGVVGWSFSGWFEALAQDAAVSPKRRRSCILLWMNGGPSQIDTFDLKPGHANGGPFKEIATNVPRIRISEHLPQLARHADRLALIRSMTSKEGDHGQAAYYLRTGYRQRGPVQYPALGSLVAHELDDDSFPLPGYVSIAPYRFFNADAYSAGFLGPRYAPLIVGEAGYQTGQPAAASDPGQVLRVPNLEPFAGLTRDRFDARRELLRGLEDDFVRGRPDVVPRSHQTAYERAVKLMRTKAAKAFNLEEEPARLRDAYGRTVFGQGCLLARRLVEQGVPFVEVTLGQFSSDQLGWDTHTNNFETVKRLSGELDAAWSSLLDDLRDHGLLDSTLVAWMGEFGRTPKINGQQGRDHYPAAWTAVLAGGGVPGGRVIGRTSADGSQVEERPVSVPDLLATICCRLGLDPRKQNLSNVGRPIRLADPAAQPIQELL
jgi:hypothetical protein